MEECERRQLIQKLGRAINESLNSECIAAAIDEIRSAGYDVFLVVEATAGLSLHRLEDEEEETRRQINIKEAPPPGSPRSMFDAAHRVKFTNQDARTAESWHISLSDVPSDDSADQPSER